MFLHVKSGVKPFSQTYPETGENDKGGKEPSRICSNSDTAEKSSSNKLTGTARDRICSILLKTHNFKELQKSTFFHC